MLRNLQMIEIHMLKQTEKNWLSGKKKLSYKIRDFFASGFHLLFQLNFIYTASNHDNRRLNALYMIR